MTWQTYPATDDFLQMMLAKACSHCAPLNQFKEVIFKYCGVRLRDIVDIIHLPANEFSRAEVTRLGWDGNSEIMEHIGGFFPAVCFGDQLKIFLRVENVSNFLKQLKLGSKPIGTAGSNYRKALAFSSPDLEVWVVERHGSRKLNFNDASQSSIRTARIILQRFRARRRWFNKKGTAFKQTRQLIQESVTEIDVHWACSLFLQAEREYWETRNKAGRTQKERQDFIGIGWANQDHHTYDNSREHFHSVIDIFELLGFECRERFYAGADAGWGSQILEQPALGSIIFADIDLAPHEINGDFAHSQLEPITPLKRAGLWVELHGESILEAGLNHLECMFDQRRLHEIFSQLNIHMMNPFSDFQHLYQALTVGEWWPVTPDRIDRLEQSGTITAEQAEDFRLNGALGSHFENLERNFGFKGFNQPGIDSVLRIIDPRKNLAGGII